ncbi:hypothetical protein ASPSYDRAFT_44210 [Aspergillus sydowii CBS 593.65]|uniref:Uncharacterized protein n=1 Tax=Aspergillus sydowii CBS 593.65 TaxID=1036612 RepID=A0A1L9TK71_9EURO|nr:uncharacterized protein ASPSYDRAFT_44210 [Aspergillus sydowii CBS 593.65]OJJ59818.1 hypothetical protein ASPSYDRAFT_44210 [Aspergillus sydowii CBS 593.65]
MTVQLESLREKLIEIRPKELLISPTRIDPKRKRHAQTQKNQRDRMKAALQLMASALQARGLDTAGPGYALALHYSRVPVLTDYRRSWSRLR